MNVSLAPLPPLPRALAQPGLSGSGRRHRIGYHEIDTVALRHFNELLQYLDLNVMPLDRDRLASAARELVDQPHAGRAPDCITQRMRRAAAIDWMVGDPDWETLPTTEVAASLLVDYMRHNDKRRTLIPNALPVVGRLDDAIVVETIWPSVGPEVRDYVDFCHVRRVEANLAGDAPAYNCNRQNWQQAARAERDWVAHCERVGAQSYIAGDPVSRFRVN
ncbi:hypothetical protein ACFQZQ_00355 [Lysobacter koreensis]|uniref:Uncharacterized protein n=1 Tax=Lysobacter koreensis TaxID=266122 RepID=A0ABW2YKV8_9GAMM